MFHFSRPGRYSSRLIWASLFTLGSWSSVQAEDKPPKQKVEVTLSLGLAEWVFFGENEQPEGCAPSLSPSSQPAVSISYKGESFIDKLWVEAGANGVGSVYKKLPEEEKRYKRASLTRLNIAYKVDEEKVLSAGLLAPLAGEEGVLGIGGQYEGGSCIIGLGCYVAEKKVKLPAAFKGLFDGIAHQGQTLLQLAHKGDGRKFALSLKGGEGLTSPSADLHTTVTPAELAADDWLAFFKRAESIFEEFSLKINGAPFFLKGACIFGAKLNLKGLPFLKEKVWSADISLGSERKKAESEWQTTISLGVKADLQELCHLQLPITLETRCGYQGGKGKLSVTLKLPIKLKEKK